MNAIDPLIARLRQSAAEGGPALNLEFWNGRREAIGDRADLTIRVNRPEAAVCLLAPDLTSLGGAYVDGAIDVIGPACKAVELAVDMAKARGPGGLFQKVRWPIRRHTLARDARVISHHYDVSNDFYRLWLDRAMVYSCAVFRRGDENLDRAQENKLDLICRKLQLQPGDRFLDIGCGWGGLILRAQRHYGVRAVGVTLSRQQFEYVSRCIEDQGLEGKVDVYLQDYRQLSERESFDKIASVGMFEHVGVKNLRSYFGTINRLLKRNGLVLNHGITTRRSSNEGTRLGAGDFIDRYVFPDGELPDVARAVAEMEGQSLEVFDIEGLRPHYAQTLMHWVARLEQRREQALQFVNEKTYRIWRIYMAGSALAFERGWISVYQLLAAKRDTEGLGAQPWRRDYMLDDDIFRPPIAAVPRWPSSDLFVVGQHAEERPADRAAARDRTAMHARSK